MTRSFTFRPLKISDLAAKSSTYYAIVDAIEKRRTIELDYSSLKEYQRIKTKVRLYTLMFYEHSWYIVGYSSMHREVRNFNVVRIESLKMLKERFSIPKSFDLDRRIGSAWALIPGSGPDSHVVVKFGSFVAHNVAQVRWHKTQRTTFQPDGSLIYEATVSGFDEIEWWILGYGDQAEVKSPNKLRQRIARRVRNMAVTYRKEIESLEVVPASLRRDISRPIR